MRVTDNADGYSATGNAYVNIHKPIEWEIKNTYHEFGPSFRASDYVYGDVDPEKTVTYVVTRTHTEKVDIEFGGCVTIKMIEGHFNVTNGDEWTSTTGMEIPGVVKYQYDGYLSGRVVFDVTEGDVLKWNCDGTSCKSNFKVKVPGGCEYRTENVQL